MYEKQVLYDTAQAVCYHEPICQTGLDYTYNTDRNRCERQAEYYEEPIIASKHCPSSRQSYNPSTDRCEAFAPAYCPSGYTDVGTYCEKTYPARYVQKTCQEAYSCNPYPCNCYESCSTDEEGNQSCTTVCSTCYETCYRDVDCSYYDCPQGGTLNGTTCVLTAPQECRDAGYVYDASIDQCRDYDPPNCKASNPNAWFYAPTDVCYWYQCDPPKNGTLYTFLQGDKYQGICYEQAVCTFSGIQGFLDGVEDRCELNPCPVGTTPSNGSQVVGNAGRCMLSTKDDVWSDTARTYVWIDKPSPKWQCSPVSCSNRLAPENKAYCLENGVNIQPTSSGQVNTWFCEYENFGGFTNIDACQNGCNWYQCSKDGRWYQGAFYVCEQNCQEQGQCTTLGN
ncbi:MAG: hypothetical protein DSY47_02690 [Hydrogenothermus sp.]|nr:MAG: hypothetical protein DSY47_02690 [Hydrogenothermus sp.]